MFNELHLITVVNTAGELCRLATTEDIIFTDRYMMPYMKKKEREKL